MTSQYIMYRKVTHQIENTHFDRKFCTKKSNVPSYFPFFWLDVKKKTNKKRQKKKNQQSHKRNLIANYTSRTKILIIKNTNQTKKKKQLWKLILYEMNWNKLNQ